MSHQPTYNLTPSLKSFVEAWIAFGTSEIPPPFIIFPQLVISYEAGGILEFKCPWLKKKKKMPLAAGGEPPRMAPESIWNIILKGTVHNNPWKL